MGAAAAARQGQALQSAAYRAVVAGALPSTLPRADVPLLSLSSAVIMHCYMRHPETFGSKYRNVFDWVLGFSWRRKGSFASLVY